MSLDDAIADIDARYPTLKANYPDVKALEQKLKNRVNPVQKTQNLEALVYNGDFFQAALNAQDVEDFDAKLANSSQHSTT